MVLLLKLVVQIIYKRSSLSLKRHFIDVTLLLLLFVIVTSHHEAHIVEI